MVSCQKKEIKVRYSELECELGEIPLDTIKLSEISRNFVPYTGLEKLFFKNETGDEIMFTSSVGPIQKSFKSIDFDLICESGNFNKYNYLREFIAIQYICEELNLQFTINQYPDNSEVSLEFADKFIFGLNEIPSRLGEIEAAIYFVVITSFRGGGEEIRQQFSMYQEYEDYKDVVLFDKEFKRVYVETRSPLSILKEVYYTEENGLIGFTDLESNLWRFDRIE